MLCIVFCADLVYTTRTRLMSHCNHVGGRHRMDPHKTTMRCASLEGWDAEA